MGKDASRRLISYLESRIASQEDTRRFGTPLLGEMAGLGRYRVEDYRITCRIVDGHLVVLVLKEWP